MNGASKLEERTRRALLVGLASLGVGAAHCDANDYPLQPTFCDDWCRVLLRTGCDEEPENCVRDCEESLPPAECMGLQRTLLDCYEEQPPSAFVCSDEGFNESTRPQESTCPTQRDALIECVYPEVKECLDVCRAAEASMTDGGVVPQADNYPSSDIPCDSICWLGLGVLANGIDVSTARDLASAFVACAVERAAACRADLDDGGAPEANWASVVRDCAEQLGLASNE